MKRSKKSPTAGRVSQKTGLPKVDPDAVEQNHVLDNMVPTQGFNELPMVGLGGSAGAISALRTFLQNVPVDSGMVFVVILHLSPEFDSSLAHVLQLSTTMVVKQAEDGEKVQRNCVYVIPPGKHLTSLDGTLRLTDLEPERGKRVAVDLFFRSLADSHGAHAMAIVLSGADGDGAIGIKRIKERGGLTIAQDPDEAEHRGMPQSAIATGMVDWVLRVAEMPARLLEYRANEARVQVPPEEGQEPTKAPKDTADEGEIALREVLDFLRARTGADFSCYKRATIVRRVSRRMQVNSLINLSAYHAFLRTHPGEAGALLQDLLISVTNFFRDREAFEALELLIPNLFQDKGPSDQVRIWVPACATGEEAYSIAMLLLEHARKLDSPPSLQVFACDLDEAAIVQARAALYPEAISADVSEERLLRFFTHEARGYRIRREVREMVLFAAHDLLKDAPFSRMDLISCRNLLIYLNREAQSRALDIFHFALRPSGLLFLGSSEAIDETSALFRVSDKKHRIFIQQPARRSGLPVPLGPGLLMRAMQVQEDSRHAPVLIGRSFGLTHLPPADAEPGTGNDHLSSSELHLRLAERIAPPSVIVNADYDIVHLSPSAGRFLQLTGGDPTLNLLRVVHPMMRVELRAALFHASESGETIEVPRVSFEFEGNHREVTLRVAPARELAPGFSIVAFDLIEMAAENAIPAARTRFGESDPMRPLELENESLKSRLRDTVEQYEASNEEQKASNEELQSMNEELRSTAEELETSREELQSVNEELSTVNGELKSRVEELNHANSDLQNLMAASAIATLFLDRDLRIMRYTPSAVSLFSLIPGDIGRPLADLRHQIEYADLSADARRVLEFLSPVERQVQSAGEWYLTRLLPYRTLDDHIAGVVLTFVNVTASKEIEEKMRASEERQAFLLELSDALRPLADPAEMQMVATRVLGVKLQANRAGYAEMQPDGQTIVLGRHYAAGVSGIEGRYRLEDFGADLEREFRAGRTVVRPDIAGDPLISNEEKAASAALEVGAMVGVPLVKEGTVVAVFFVHQAQPRAWSTEEVRLLEEAADRTWATVERARAEEARTRSEEKYRTLFDSIDQGFSIVEVIQDAAGTVIDFRYREVNRAYEQQTGLQNVVGRLISEVMPQMESYWMEQFDRVVRTGEPTRFENYNVDSGRWYQANFARVGGSGSRLVGIVFDEITERKRREHQAAFLDELSQALAIIGSPDEIVRATGERLGAHLNVSFLNVVDVELDGAHEPQEALFTVCSAWEREGLPNPRGTYRAGDYLSSEFLLTARAGETIVVRDTDTDPRVDAEAYRAIGMRAFVAVPILQDGAWPGLISAFAPAPRDWRPDEAQLITDVAHRVFHRIQRARAEEALRESQNQLRLALDAAEMGTFLWYPQDDRAEMDARVFALYGLREGDTLNVAEAIAKLVHPDDRELFAAAIAAAIDPNGDGKLEMEFRVVHPDDSLHWLHSQGQTVFEGENPPRAALMYGMIRDITERKRRETNLAFLAETSADFTPLFRAEEIMERVGSRLAKHLNLSRCDFSIVDEEADRIDCLYAWRRDDSMLDVLGAHSITTFLSEEGRRHYAAGKFAVINDVRSDSLLNPAAAEKFDGFSIRSIVNAPYLKDGRWKFLLTAARSEVGNWRDDETELIRELAERIYLRIERARAEDAVRESEEQFRSALEDAPIPVIMQAEDGQVLQISNTWTELTGYSREEITTFEAWLNHAYGSGADIVRDHVRELFDGKLRQIELEIEVKTRSGEKRHWAFSASAPGRLRDGRRFIVGMALDITERTAASAALSESQERLRMVVENAREYAIFSLDPQRHITTWNSGAEAILGWSEKEILGQSADIIFTAEDRANDMAGQEMQTALKKGRAEDERWHLRKDGSRFWASGVMMPMRDMQNQITGFVKIFRDQTQSRFDEEARREAEERFRILVDSVQDYAIFLLDAEGFITSWNQGAARIKGYTEEEVIGQHVSLFYTTDEITDNLPQKEMATARAHGRSENESWRAQKDGSLFWVNEIMISLRDSSGGFAKISRDLTERKKFEDELTKLLAAAQSARQDAEAAGKAKDHFIAVLSHELRTPLTPVFLAVQALRHTKNLPPFAVESIEMIDRNVKLEARMIDDLLDLTRMAHGKIELQQDEVDLHHAIHDALQVAQGDIQGRRQKLSVELEATQFTVCGDFARLQQVFWNLLKNASKFAPFDGSIGVQSRNENDQIVVSITDNGIGIAPDALARIFEAFTQADDTINRHFGGLGLGLSIASATISGLGGTLSADSTGQGHGAVFTVRLPLLSPASS